MLLGRIDRYLLKLMVRPVLGCLAITLSALLLERVLRMWMHAISPLTGDLGASPYFKLVDGKVRC